MPRQQPPPALPSAPTGLLAVAVGGRQVLLAWTAGGDAGQGFRIERAVHGGPRTPFVEIGGVGPHVTAFRDAYVLPGTTYSYRVHAWNASGDSQHSNGAEATTRQDGTEPQDD